MKVKYNKNLLQLSRNLRNNMTKEERKLWYEFLKNYPINISRQKIIGKYIVDFYCAKAKLIIELDGTQHFENDGIKSDKERSSNLEGMGLTIIRFPNNYIYENFDGVCQYIDITIKQLIEKEKG